MSDIAAVTDALRENPVFARLDAKRLRIVALTGEVLSFRPGEELFRRGEAGDAAYVVIGGRALVNVPTPDGERTIARLGRGELFGEIAALCDRPRTTSIAAEDMLTCLRLDREELRSLLRDFPALSLELIRILADRLERTNDALAAAGGPAR